MPRVAGGNGPMRRPGAVLSNHSGSDSDDEGGGPAASGGAARQPDAPAWRASDQQSDQASSALFEQYMAAGGALGDDLGKDQVFQQGMSRVRDHLTNVDSSCCLICLNHIRPTEAVWHCGRGCFTVLHLVCLQEWARSQLDAAGAKAAARLTQFPAAADEARATAEWGCPKCRSTYPAADIPRQYKCFCGKATNPDFDPWITPHSCGEVCGRPLPGGCGHECLLLCHPGPCPPCPLVVDAGCYCGARQLKRRCGHHEYSCEGVCGAKLACGHRCPDTCHPGECGGCRVLLDLSCRCGAERKRLPCSERGYQCGRVCGQQLACGNHVCEKVCHAGPCGECPSAGERTCPCGRVSHEGLSCADKVPTCGETCGRLLRCGVHRCKDRCHHGECTVECRGPALKTCRCGKSQKEVLCLTDFTCERRCSEMRACGRHACKRRCCDGNCPPCEEVCGRRLKCGNHKCPAPCHSGPCRPCPLTGTVSCACGRSACTLPCGAESRAEPPHCPAPCSVPRICRHGPCLPPHRCHYGPCPPCPGPCSTPLACGHSCASPACHDPPPPPVPDFQPPAPPKAVSIAAAAAAAAAAAVAAAAAGGERERASRSGSAALPAGPAVQQPTALAAQILAATAARGELPSACPPCEQPVQVGCVGAHVRRALPCAQARPYCCPAACGRPLQCGNHACGLPCHAVAYDPIATAVAAAAAAAAATSGYPDPLVPRPCRQCDRRCDRPRGCAHPCKLACHRGPCPRCEVQSRTACLCGRSTLQLACHQAAAAAAAGGDAAAAAVLSCGKPCHRQLLYCSHPCKATCHAGACPDPGACAAEVNVRCDCPAKRRAKWRCADVQAALEKAGKPRSYDDSQPPRLLPCDADCAKAKAKGGAAAAAAPGAASKAAAAASAAPSAAAELSRAQSSNGGSSQVVAAEAGAGAGGKGGKARLTRAEREAAAAAKEVERRRQERLTGVVRGVLLAVVVALGVLLALGAKQLLAWLDARMYDPGAVPRRG